MIENIKVLHKFSESAGMKCELIEFGGQKCVRKTGAGTAARRLENQKLWLERHSHLEEVPAILAYGAAAESTWIDLKYYENIISLFGLCLDPRRRDFALAKFRELMGFVDRNILSGAGENPTPADFNYYIQSKLVQKLELSSELSPEICELMKAQEININGIRQKNIRFLYGEIANHRDLRDFVLSERSCDIHGDLTLENTFVSSDRLLLLDPNQENWIPTPSVEYAKLAQSIHSGYELLKGGRITELKHNAVAYTHPSPPEIYGELLKIVETVVPRNVLYFQEAIHFARLLPYRIKADPKRAPIYFAKCVELLNASLGWTETISYSGELESRAL